VDVNAALYARIAENLARRLFVRGDESSFNLVESPKENWSLGEGSAQYPRAAPASTQISVANLPCQAHARRSR